MNWKAAWIRSRRCGNVERERRFIEEQDGVGNAKTGFDYPIATVICVE